MVGEEGVRGGEARKCSENLSTLEAEMLLLGFRFLVQGVKGGAASSWVLSDDNNLTFF